jgi:hypothetical protein
LAAVVAACEVVAALGRTSWPTRCALTVRAAFISEPPNIVVVVAGLDRPSTEQRACGPALAPPGAVLISDTTARLVRDHLPADLDLAFLIPGASPPTTDPSLRSPGG